MVLISSKTYFVQALMGLFILLGQCGHSDADEPARTLPTTQTGTTTRPYLPSGSPKDVPQVDISFCKRCSDGTLLPYKLQKIELLREGGGDRGYYLDATDMVISVGKTEDSRVLVEGDRYYTRGTPLKAEFKVPRVEPGKVAHISLVVDEDKNPTSGPSTTAPAVLGVTVEGKVDFALLNQASGKGRVWSVAYYARNDVSVTSLDNDGRFKLLAKSGGGELMITSQDLHYAVMYLAKVKTKPLSFPADADVVISPKDLVDVEFGSSVDRRTVGFAAFTSPGARFPVVWCAWKPSGVPLEEVKMSLPRGKKLWIEQIPGRGDNIVLGAITVPEKNGKVTLTK